MSGLEEGSGGWFAFGRGALHQVLERRYRAVVFGGSAGGLQVLVTALAALPAGFGFPILLVQHLHQTDEGRYAKHLGETTGVPVVSPNDKEPILPGRVYVAPANYHMLVEREGTIALSVDARVNWSRPSIDVLFESCAWAWGEDLIGILLSGANFDGTVGLQEIKKRGGLVVAQDPESAEHPVMPNSAIRAGVVDFVLTPAQIGALLAGLAGKMGSVLHGDRCSSGGCFPEERVIDQRSWL